MKRWELFTPAERRLAALLFMLTLLGEGAHTGRRISPEVAAWLDGEPRRAGGAPESLEVPSRPVPESPLEIPPVPLPRAASAALPDTSSAIDPNVADLETLLGLPGVGPVLARRILEDRAQHGRYNRPEDLLRVPGIGPATLAKLRPHLAVGGKTHR